MSELFAGYRVKKRTFAVAGLAFLVSLVTAVMIGFYAFSLIGSDVLFRFQLKEEQQPINLPGSGINISDFKSSNMIVDGSFEPFYYRHFLTAYDGDESSLIVSSEDASRYFYKDEFFTGADIRVYGQTTDGLRLKKQGKVSSYGLNQVGVFQSIRMPADMQQEFSLSALTSWQNKFLLVGGSDGLVLTVDNNQVIALTDTGINEEITDICTFENEILVSSANGTLAFSNDSVSWQEWYPGGINNLNSIAVNSKGMYTAVGNNGFVISGRDGVFFRSFPKIDDNLVSVEALGDGWLAVGEAGTIIYSENAISWEIVNEKSSQLTWSSISTFENGALIVGGNGKSAIYRTDMQNKLQIISENFFSHDLVDIIKVTDAQFIAIDSSGLFYISNDEGETWTSSDINLEIKAKRLAILENKIYCIDGNNKLGNASLVAKIKIDSPLQDGLFQAGDLIFMELDHYQLKSTVTHDDLITFTNTDDSWHISGNTEIERMKDESAPSGEGYLRLTIDNEGFIYQSLNSSDFIDQSDNVIFNFSGWFNSQETSRTITVQITGLKQPAEITLEIASDDWRRYSGNFIIPANWIDPEADIFINIGSKDRGEILIDELLLVSALDGQKAYTSDFIKTITGISPQVIRFAGIPIGKITAPPESWAMHAGQDGFVLAQNGWHKNRENSLTEALTIAKNTHSEPWLVIDSFTSETEINNLMEYLAAPVSEKYGKLRMEQGSAVAWTDYFSRFYIEITDENNLFKDDRIKSSYVDWVINQIYESPYYLKIKNSLIFIDGMKYDQGIMLSSADYYATDLQISERIDKVDKLEKIYLDYWSRLPRNPEKSTQSWPSMIKTVNYDKILSIQNNNINLASLVGMLTYDLGQQTSLIMNDLDSKYQSDNRFAQINEKAAEIISAASTGEAFRVERLAASDEIYLFATRKNNSVKVVICNAGELPANCQIVTDFDISGANIIKYDAEGNEIGTEKLRKNESQITILPGGVVYLEKLDS